MSEQGRILVVDDHRTNRLKLVLGLSRQGHSVEESANGRDALARLREKPFDLILLDILMPIMSGMEMLEEIKKNEEWKNIPVILLTNVGEKESIQKVREMGVKNYLIKSHFTPAEVIEKIESVFKENKSL